MAKAERVEVCNGIDREGAMCPLKDNCARYRENINRVQELWIAWAPFRQKGDQIICTYKLLNDGRESIDS
jgi:hypothetical protein